MNEILEISSDSNDTIIIGMPENIEECKYINVASKEKASRNIFRNKYNLDSDNESFDDVDINKISKFNHKPESGCDILKDLSEKYNILEDIPTTSGNDLDSSPLEGLLYDKSPKKYLNECENDIITNLTNKYNLLSNIPSIPKNLSHSSSSEEINSNISPKKRKTDQAATNKLNKVLIRQEKERKRLEKRNEIEREKAEKKALAANYKNLKPEECIKFVTIHLDEHLLQEEYAKEILTVLRNSDVLYKTGSNIVPNTITWCRRIESSLVDETGTLVTSTDISETNDVLLIMNWKDFIIDVNNHNLTIRIHSLKSVLHNKKVSLAIYGLTKYFKFHKNLHYQINNKKPNKANKIFEDCPVVSRKSVEFALTELELLESCSCRMIENEIELGEMVFQFTKAIAQLPYKLQKQQKYAQAERFLVADNKDCVRVDKNGNGLSRLWQQILVTFPLARLETAEAILTKYPTPLKLMKAYQRCPKDDGEKLLQDIPIRRAAGPLTSVRKIGPELSKKIYKFFTSLDGNLLL